MSKRAIISDIHGNLEALEAVLGDIKAEGISHITCLGDFVGYGPNPAECTRLVMEHCNEVVIGNHDRAMLSDPDGFNPVAYLAIVWSREQFEQQNDSSDLWDFIRSLPTQIKEGDFLFVHGSPKEPTDEYLFPDDIHDQDKLSENFKLVDRYCFCGHTHSPGIFKVDDFMPQYFLEESKVDLSSLDKSILNVGSVGQPRDHNPKSCYVVLDGTHMQYRRVEYDVETTVSKILAISDLGKFSAERLREGK